MASGNILWLLPQFTGAKRYLYGAATDGVLVESMHQGVFR